MAARTSYRRRITSSAISVLMMVLRSRSGHLGVV